MAAQCKRDEGVGAGRGLLVMQWAAAAMRLVPDEVAAALASA